MRQNNTTLSPTGVWKWKQYFLCTHYQWADGRCALSVKTIFFLARMPILNSIHTCYCLYNNSFIHQWPYSPLLGPGLFFSFIIFFTQSVVLLGRGISPSQGGYLHTGEHKHRTNAETSMPWVGFEPTIPAFERAKTVHASDRAATVTGACIIILLFIY
jgi:hypothetical protein